MAERRRNRQLEVKVDRGVLTISIGLDLLKHALEYAPQLEFHNDESESFEHPKITSIDDFAEEMVSVLSDEDEDGTTPVHRLLDKAALDALEQGAEGIELPEFKRAALSPTEGQ